MLAPIGVHPRDVSAAKLVGELWFPHPSRKNNYPARVGHPVGIYRAFSPSVLVGYSTWGVAPGWYNAGLWPFGMRALVWVFGPEGAVPDSTQAPLGLLLFWRGFFVFEVLEVEDGVEDQRVAADGFAAVDGVVAEEQHVALAEVCIDDDGVFGDGIAFVQQAGEQAASWRLRSAGSRLDAIARE